MKKRKIPKTSKRRLLFFGTLSLIIIGYTVFTIFYYTYNISNINRENKKLEDQLMNLQNNEENLRLEILKLKDPEYVARYARENYSYSKDGEYIIKIDEKEKSLEITENTKKNDYYLVVFIGMVVTLVLLFIVFKIFKKKKPID